MGKKKGKGGSATGKDFWDGLQGWRTVDVGDDLLLGADEYGFCGLEELDARSLGDLVIPGTPATVADEQPPPTGGQDEKQQAADKKGGKKRKQPEAAAAGGDDAPSNDEDAAAGKGAAGGESVEDLKRQLAALKAENKQLKKKQKQEAKADKKAAAAEKKAAAKAAKVAAKQAAAEAGAAAQQQQKRVDISAWKELQLHASIEAAIAKLGFEAPTHVQAECLPAAIRDRRDVIGAAQTGSGKTLAFGLPIMQLLLQERQQQQQGAQDGSSTAASKPLRALILAPTRELAMQVCAHLQAVGRECGIWVVPIVGGISALKQERLLSKQPEVIVATPGRLWDLMREGHSHVTNLTRLSFLVIDEADRMVQQGHYGELSSILGAIPTHQAAAEPEAAEPEDEPPPEEGQQGTDAGRESAEEDGEAGQGGEKGEEDEAGEGGYGNKQPAKQPPKLQRRMQTFVFSATLTLPANLRRRLRKGGGGASGSSDLESLMDKIPFRGKPKIVDLTSERKLADKVTEAYLACGEAERDEYLYCLLAKHPGRTIVFVNAISAVRRLAAILKLLGLPAQPLHAGMQQRQRLRALDRFRADPAAVLVATDVAARGLDIKDVRCVVHYQLPASVDVYVHRSGRTARAEAEGLSVALVTPKENARFLALLKAMKREEPPEFPLDLSLMPAVHKRVRLAVRLDELERRQSKQRAEQSWRRQHAEQLGIELSDDDEDEEGGLSGRRQGKKARREAGGKRGPEDSETAAELRAQLAALLSEPLQPKFSQKWFTGGAAAAVMAAVDPSAPLAAAGKKRKKAAGAAAAGAEAGAGAAEGGEAAAQPLTAQTVHQAVALARQRSDSRSRVAQREAAKQQARQRKGGQAPGQGANQAQQQQQQHSGSAQGSGPASGRRKGGKKAQDPRAAALQAALSKALATKQKKKAGGRGMLVIPQALGRDAAGPDALQALRAKLAAR